MINGNRPLILRIITTVEDFLSVFPGADSGTLENGAVNGFRRSDLSLERVASNTWLVVGNRG